MSTGTSRQPWILSERGDLNYVLPKRAPPPMPHPGPEPTSAPGAWASVGPTDGRLGFYGLEKSPVWPAPGPVSSQEPFPFVRQLHPTSVQRPQTPRPAGTVSKPTDEACVKPWLGVSVVLLASLSPSHPPGAQPYSSRRHFCSTNTHLSACPRRGASAQRRVADRTPSEDPGRS